VSSAGRWDYSKDTIPAAYGDDTTYRRGAVWLAGLDVEDWGCGLGWFRKFHNPVGHSSSESGLHGGYVGIDGSTSPFCDKVADLTTYRSQTSGLFMRHVLEHNEDWRDILYNALQSFSKRMALVLFTPLEIEDRVLTFAGVPIPDIALCGPDVASMVSPYLVRRELLVTKTRYMSENVFYLEKKS
jgi:hypothetical protein